MAELNTNNRQIVGKLMFSDEIMTNIDMDGLITVDGGVISGGQLAIRGQSLQVGEANILDSRPNVFAVGS